MTKNLKGMRAFWNSLFKSRVFTIIASIALGIICWFVISISVYPTTPRTINNIPVTVELAGTAAEENGLSVIDMDVSTISVQIEGNRSDVGNLDADNMVARVVTDDVTSAGTKSLSFHVESTTGVEFTVKSMTPSKVNVTFDCIKTYTFDITPSIPNITFAEGCVLDEDNLVCTPSTIEVTGPQSQLDQVTSCVAEVEESDSLSASHVFVADTLQFYNEGGAEMDSEDLTYDAASFTVEVPVLYQKTMDILYQITNAPSNFDLDCLNLSLSEEKITLAAPNNSVEDMDEFNIGSVALRDIDLDFSQDFVVDVPDEYENCSGFTVVNLSLDSTGLAKKDFVLTDIGVVNAPASYDFEVLTQQLTVSMIGPEDVLEKLDASDITANVDLLSYSVQANGVEGDSVTFNYTPTISCAKYNNVWAVGDYHVSVQGNAQSSENESTQENSETE